MDLVSTCKRKLAYFRIKELKDVLFELRLPKQGRKQDLVDRILCLLSTEELPPLHSLPKKRSIGKERVAKIIDDAYRKMLISDAADLATKAPGGLDVSAAREEEVQDFDVLDKEISCPCGKLQPTECTIRCMDRKCQVEQHINCVVIPSNPMESKPPIPPLFYCEKCRIKRADPFWVTVAYILMPMKLIDSHILPNGANQMQSVEQKFQLTKADQDLLQNTDYDVQVWCMLLNDNVLFRMQWPQYASLWINDMPVRLVNRPGTQLLGANGRDDGALIKSFLVEGINKFCLSACDTRVFCFAIRLVKRLTVDKVLSLIPKEKDGELFEDALARVCRCIGGGMDTKNEDCDSDVEVIADSITVNLRCPMSGSRIKHAGRFKPCLHMGCFDLETFVELTQRTRKWQCPICLKNYCLEDVIIDPYFNQIATMMRHCGEDVTEIMVKPDGSWAAKTKGEIGDLGQWHRPDGSLFDATRKVTSPVEMSRHIEKGYNLELYGSPEYGIEENINGIVQVDKHKHTSVSSMDQLEENFGITMRHSAAGSGREEEDMSMDQRCVTDHFSPSSFIDINSISRSFDPRCGLNNSCSAPHNADIIVLSDSDEENDNVVPGAAYGAGLVNQSSSLTAHLEMPNSLLKLPELDAGVRSSFDVFNNDGYDVRMHSSSYPSSIEAGAIIQHLGEDLNITDSLIDLEHTSVNGSAPASGYNWASTAALSSAASIAVLDGKISTKRRSKKKFCDGPFSFPRQPRSVRKRICSKLTYF